MTKKQFFSPTVLITTYKYMEFHLKQNQKRDFEFFTTPYLTQSLRRSKKLKITSKTGYKPNRQFLTTFWTFSQPRMNGLIFRLLNVVRHPETQVQSTHKGYFREKNIFTFLRVWEIFQGKIANLNDQKILFQPRSHITYI